MRQCIVFTAAVCLVFSPFYSLADGINPDDIVGPRPEDHDHDEHEHDNTPISDQDGERVKIEMDMDLIQDCFDECYFFCDESCCNSLHISGHYDRFCSSSMTWTVWRSLLSALLLFIYPGF